MGHTKGSAMATSIPIRQVLAAAAVPLMFAPAATAAPLDAHDGKIVEQQLPTGHHLNVYVPDDPQTGHRARSTPILLVLADGAITADGALALAESSGLADIARTEHGVVAFLNPLGESWAASDTAAIPATLDRFDGFTGEPYDVDGQRCVSGQDGQQVCKFPGTDARVYLFGDRSGADFITEQLVAGIDTGDYRGTPWTPTAVYLSNPGASAVVPDGDIEVPAYVVNGSDRLEASLERLNQRTGLFGTASSSKRPGFDRAALLKGYDRVIEHAARRWWTLPAQIYTLPDPKALGLRVEQDVFDVDGQPLEYYTYEPRKQAGSVPLVMVFHGGSDNAEFMVWSTGWAQTAAEHGFMVVSVDQHVARTPGQMVTLLDHLLAENPRIDPSRIYASGFSMGSVKSFELSEQFPSRFAAIAPMSGSFAPGHPEGGLVPTIYFAGMSSTLPERPHQNGAPNDIDARLNDVLGRNGVAEDYAFDAAADPVWGIAPDEQLHVADDLFTDVSVTAKAFGSDDGNIYTVLAEANSVSHESLPIESEIAWAFLSQFSRGADGKVAITDGHFDLAKLDTTR
jgi:dienelactone hydrolase